MTVTDNEKRLVDIGNRIIGTMIKKGISPEDAKDMVQTSFVKFFESGLPVMSDSLQAWLYRVSFNEYYTSYNRSKKYQEIQKKYLEPEYVLSEEREANFDDLYEVLHRLDERAFNLILLKYVEKLSYDELAIIFDSPASSLKTECYRIRKKLQHDLKEMKQHDD